MIKMLEKCPDRQALEDFMLGRLPGELIDCFREHLSECNPCVDTIRNLDVTDTLDDLAKAAFTDGSTESARVSSSDSQLLDRLVQKMERLGNIRTETRLRETTSSPTADRAAEVQRLVQGTDREGLGQLAQYRLTELLGAGSTGVVYKAIDEKLQRPVALKILRPSLGLPARERFIAEARATAAIEHPNVVTIFDVGYDGPLAYIAMQWLEGQTLEQQLANCKALTTNQTITLGMEVSAGLQAAHEQGLIHRDIKPANIWIPDDGSGARILDFGLVRITEEDPQLTCTGMIAGTPCYMSPEQSRGESLDGRSDLFSLGCLLYQSVTGRLPFRCDNALATLQSIQREQPPTPQELNPATPADLSDLIMCLLEKSSLHRPAAAREVTRALQSERQAWSFRPGSYGSANSARNITSRTRPGLSKWLITAILAAILSVGGIAFGPQIIRIVTNHGELQIETDDPNVKIEVLQNGDLVQLIDLTTEQQVTIRAGKYELVPQSNENRFEIDRNVLTIKRGSREIVRVTRQPIAKPVDATGSRPLPSDLAEVGQRQRSVPHRLDVGDVLGIYIEGVLGKYDEPPPFHFPPPSSGLAPSSGFPIAVDSDGTISLPLIQPIDVRGKSIVEVKQQIVDSYCGGDVPILTADKARILVSLMQPRNYRPPARQPAEAPVEPIPAPPVNTTTLSILPGDVLGMYIEGVLGNPNEAPPVNIPDPSSGLPPTIGYPIAVEADGTISLPLIEPISVENLTQSQVKSLVDAAYKDGNQPILKDNARIVVTFMHLAARATEAQFRELQSRILDAREDVAMVFQDNPEEALLKLEEMRIQLRQAMLTPADHGVLTRLIEKDEQSVFRHLKNRVTTLQHLIQGQGKKYGDQHPKMIELKKELTRLESLLNAHHGHPPQGSSAGQIAEPIDSETPGRTDN